MTFTYRSKGSADEWTTETVEADNLEAAREKLDEIYGVMRDKDGKQTNADMIQVEIIGQA